MPKEGSRDIVKRIFRYAHAIERYFEEPRKNLQYAKCACGFP